MKKFFTIAILVLTVNAFAQNWQQTIGTTSNEVATSVIFSNSGNYIICGYSDDNSSFVAELDVSGTILWQKKYSINTIPIVFNNIIQSTSGGYFVCGYTGQLWSDNKPILIKLSNTGSVSFIKEQNSFGYSKALYENSNNEILTGGFNPSIAMYNSIGDSVWTQKHEDNSSFAIEYSEIVTANNNEYFAVGNLNTIGQPLLTKFDSNGDTIWHKQEDFAMHQAIMSAVALNDGSVITVLKDGNIYKWDNSGNVLWGKAFSGIIFKKILKSPDGGFFCAGNYLNDYFLMKLDGGGNLSWINTYGSSLNEDLMAATIDSNSNIVLVGTTLGFGSSGTDIYIVKTDSLGNSPCYMTQSNTSSSNSTIVTTSKLVKTSGSTQSNIALNENTLNYSSNVLCTTIGILESKQGNQIISVYPNPTHNQITVDFGHNYTKMDGYELKITNSLSQIVYTSPINTQIATVDLSTWKGKGIYFVHLIDASSNTIAIRKIVIQ